MKEEKISKVNVRNDKEMVELGIRPAPVTPRDPKVWTKTKYEKRILKEAKYSCRGGNGHFYPGTTKWNTFYGKLIVQLKSNKVFSKSTYSMICGNNDVQRVLSRFIVENHKTKQMESVVRKYSYNGITYVV